MNKILVYVAGFLGAVFAAGVLHVLAQDELGISQQSIVFNSLSSAGILSVACVVGMLVKMKK